MSLELARLPATPRRPCLRVVIVTTEAERRACFRLRADIYVDELGILPADHPYVGPDGLEDPYDAWSTNLLLLAGDTPIGTARVTQAADGPLELEEYVDLDAVGGDRSLLADGTRFMVRKAWRRTAAGPLLALATYRLLRRSQAQVFLVAGKLNNLGRYYKNAGIVPVSDVPAFTYELTGCRYELLAADFGTRGSLRRLTWSLRAAVLAALGVYLGDLTRRLLRLNFRRPAAVTAAVSAAGASLATR